MSYATKQDLIDRYTFAELQQVSSKALVAGGGIDDEVIAVALADAEAEINGYLASRMTTPVSPVPRILTKRACEIARYLLWSERASAKVRGDYEDAVAWLKDVAKDLVSLGDDTSATETVSAGAPQIDAPRRQFTRRTLKDF